jgi:hypothetical protein
MKLRWLKTIKTEYVPTGKSQSSIMPALYPMGQYPFQETHYKKQQKVDRKLQYWDTEYSQWVDVEEVVITEGE